MDMSVFKDMERVDNQKYYKEINALIMMGNLDKMKEFTLNHLDEMPNIIHYVNYELANWHFDILKLAFNEEKPTHKVSQWLAYFHEVLKVPLNSCEPRNNNNNVLQHLIRMCSHQNEPEKYQENIIDAFNYLINHMDLNQIKNNHVIATMIWESSPQLRKILLPMLEKNSQYLNQIEDGLSKKGVYQNNPLLFKMMSSNFNHFTYENVLEFFDKYQDKIDFTMHGSANSHNILFAMTNGVRHIKTLKLFSWVVEKLKKIDRVDLFYEINPNNESILYNYLTFLMLTKEEEIRANLEYIITNFSNLTPLILHVKKDKSIYQLLIETKRFPDKTQIIINYLNIILEKEKLDIFIKNNELLINRKKV